MIEEMQYVYSLCCDGNVFYIGRTNDIVRRYKQHIKGRNKSTSEIINKYVQQEKIIDMKVLDYLPAFEAQVKESIIIKLIIATGHIICNNINQSGHPYLWWERDYKPKIANYKNMLLYLDHLQKSKKYHHELNNKISNTEYPKKPIYE